MILKGDLFDVLPTLRAESFDACVTDPPYDLTSKKKGGSGVASVNLNSPYGRARIGTGNGAGGFMGKKWDGTGVAFKVETWEAVFNILKPGAYLLAFGGTRTYHRMVVAIEDAGFEIRDCLIWLYGSGFPKSKNLGDGKGTALKPGYEPIVLAWKPFKGTIKACHEKHGTAALNIEACRVESEGPRPWRESIGDVASKGIYGEGLQGSRAVEDTEVGRWPTNVALDEEAAELLDEQTGERRSGERRTSTIRSTDTSRHTYGKFNGAGTQAYPRNMPASSGGASRFFYCAKASRRERDLGCGDLPLASGGELTHRREGSAGLNSPRAGAGRTSGGRNTHPTVKPLALMRWLVRLVTPEGGRVLDPFAGSGSTGMACVHEGRRFVGIEREAVYVEIARCRIRATKQAVVEFGQP